MSHPTLYHRDLVELAVGQDLVGILGKERVRGSVVKMRLERIGKDVHEVYHELFPGLVQHRRIHLEFK